MALCLAGAHPVQARVALWVAGLAGFGLAAYPGRRHSLHVGATVVLSVLVLVWMFGATLVWGTARSTQLRLPGIASNGVLGWEGTALLILAVVGVASIDLALRYFTLARPRLGWALTASAVACFGLWSLGVAYPVTAAVLAGAIGLVATAIVYLLRWRRALIISAAASTAFGCAWLASWPRHEICKTTSPPAR